ncbi:phage portal protein, lambda family [Anaerohalosphaera lusitana]|uniref:Phage portal protein, lambda family n=1 Tax=Anaerohalosphaera lusitana TaxID=1936003 RepID=A0A1U9NQD9_9BACT|nr:phage portal protein [Anaerohalosphaera lusitana]AQT69954.1 phage portal protein, lambda family [Anaerohalosphaera lusitana]
MRIPFLNNRKKKGKRAPGRKDMERQVRQAVQRYYEVAASNAQTIKSFGTAQAGDPNDWLSDDVQTLRARASYEIRHNGYAKGMTRTRANDLIGTRPRLQFRSGNAKFDEAVEREWALWAGTSDNPVWGVGYCDAEGTKSLSDILKIACARHQDDSGDGYIIMTRERRGPGNWRQRGDRGVRLRLRLVHPDRIMTPWGVDDDSVKDGIEYDANGRPAYYYVMKEHPNSATADLVGKYEKIPAKYVLHYFEFEYADQAHGEPRITPSLWTWNKMRRYTEAVVGSAELAACLAGIITGDSDPDDDEVLDWDTVEIVKNALMTVPGGGDIHQFKAEQPTGTYKEFKAELLNEAARPSNMPYNVAAGNSSGYNYSSGRLDKQEYQKDTANERHGVETRILAAIAAEWLREAMLIPGFLPSAPPEVLRNARGGWYWDGVGHVDPQKEANAQETRLHRSKVSNFADECAKDGKDWQQVMIQRAKEKEFAESLGLNYEQAAVADMPPQNGNDDQDDDDEDEDDEQ